MIELLDTIEFAQPIWLFAILLLPLVAWSRGRKSVSVMIVPFAGAWRKSALISGSRLPTFLAFLAAVSIIVALARPQSVTTERHSKSKGYDIMLAIDLSGSMEAEDEKIRGQWVNRLHALKPVLNAFINKRENDRIGLIAFAGRAYTVAPLTFDHDWLERQTERLQTGLIEDGTAIGDTLAVATSRLQEGAKERAGEREGAFIVLLTDGENTAGMLEPDEGSKLAKDAGIRVYTIGVGRNGLVRYPIKNKAGQRIGTDRVRMAVDLDSLRKIAADTNGTFFNAVDSNTISAAFKQIDETSKIEFEVQQYSIVTELFPYVLLFSGAAAMLASLSSLSFRKGAIA